jgi:FkbM family methyltransferase
MSAALSDALLQAALILYPWRSGRKKLVRFAASRLSGPVVWRTGDGTRLLLDPGNYIDREVVEKGGYETDRIAHLVERVARCDVFFDVGANIGLYSIAVGRHTGVPVIAFEPDPRNYHQLAANVFLNGLGTRVALRHEAVGPRTEAKTLYAQRDPRDFSTGRSTLVRAGEGTVEVPVRAVALDDEFGGWAGRSIAMKMDIEGFELHALAGMEALFRRNRVFLQVEITENREAVRARLAALGMVELPQLNPGTGDYYFETGAGGASA